MAATAPLSVSQDEIYFGQVANTAMKMNGAITGDSETGQSRFKARQWAALIVFCDVETRKQVKNIWKKIEKSRDAMEVRTIVVTAIKEQQVDGDRQSSWVCFGDDAAEDIWKCIFTYTPMANMEKTEQGILIMVFIRCTAQEIW